MQRRIIWIESLTKKFDVSINKFRELIREEVKRVLREGQTGPKILAQKLHGQTVVASYPDFSGIELLLTSDKGDKTNFQRIQISSWQVLGDKREFSGHRKVDSEKLSRFLKGKTVVKTSVVEFSVNVVLSDNSDTVEVEFDDWELKSE